MEIDSSSEKSADFNKFQQIHAALVPRRFYCTGERASSNNDMVIKS